MRSAWASTCSRRKLSITFPFTRRGANGATARKVTVDLPLFPGYVFVRIDRSERVRVLQVPGVLSVVGGTGRQPASMPDAEIDALRAGLSLRTPSRTLC